MNADHGYNRLIMSGTRKLYSKNNFPFLLDHSITILLTSRRLFVLPIRQ